MININYIENVSPTLFQVLNGSMKVQKVKNHLRVEKVKNKDNDLNRYQGLSSYELYEIMKNQGRRDIVRKDTINREK